MKTYLTATETATITRRNYSHRSNVDWYDEASGHPPRHNQKNRTTRKYWNALRGEWCSKKSRKTPGTGQAVTMHCPLNKSYAADASTGLTHRCEQQS